MKVSDLTLTPAEVLRAGGLAEPQAPAQVPAMVG